MSRDGHFLNFLSLSSPISKKNYLELIDWVERVDGWNTSIFQSKQCWPKISASISRCLSNQNKVRSEWPRCLFSISHGKKIELAKNFLSKCHEHTKMMPNHLRSRSITHNRDSWTVLTTCGDGYFAEISLLDAQIVIAMQSLTAEIFWPIGVLIVNDKQREATIFIKSLHAWDSRGGSADYACTLISCCACQWLNALQETFTRFRGTWWSWSVLWTALAKTQRQFRPCRCRTSRCWCYL